MIKHSVVDGALLLCFTEILSLFDEFVLQFQFLLTLHTTQLGFLIDHLLEFRLQIYVFRTLVLHPAIKLILGFLRRKRCRPHRIFKL